MLWEVRSRIFVNAIGRGAAKEPNEHRNDMRQDRLAGIRCVDYRFNPQLVHLPVPF